MAALVIILVVLAVGALIAVSRSVKVVQQYEQGIVFRFGRVLPEIPQARAGCSSGRSATGMQKTNMQIVAMEVPAQEGITRDNVTVRVDAVVYFRVVDPIKAEDQRAELPLRHLPAGTDFAAVDHRPV